MRLVVNAVNIAPGGGLTGLLGYLQSWEDIGCPDEIIVIVGRQQVADAVRRHCPSVEVVSFCLGLSAAWTFAAQQLFLGKKIERMMPDVVLGTQYGTARCGCPQLIHHRNLKRFTESLWARIRRGQVGELVKDIAARISLAKAPCNVFISQYLQEAAASFVPGSAGRSQVVHNGLPQALVAQAEVQVNQGRQTGNLLAIQATAEHKDNPTLLRVVKLLIERRPHVDWKLSVIGGGDWGRWQALAEDLGIADRVYFRGYIDHAQLSVHFRQALCLVFTSRLEGFGNPLLEAMAHQCPVVACDCTAIPEVAGAAAILVPPGDPAAFAQAILQLQDNDDLRDTLVARGLERIRNFTWEKAARQMLKLFAQMTDKQHGKQELI